MLKSSSKDSIRMVRRRMYTYVDLKEGWAMGLYTDCFAHQSMKMTFLEGQGLETEISWNINCSVH